MMGRALAIVVLLWVLCALSVRAGNPDDIDFVLRLTKDTPVYHTGEVIEFEISYSGRSERKYRGSWTTPSPDLEVVTLHVTPSQGVFDRRRLRDSLFAGSILSGIGYLGSQPVTMTADLAGWYRFDKPGYYTLAVTSPQVSGLKSAEEGGGEEPVTLESNTVEFDVLPPDGAWERQELWSIQNALENAADAGEKERAYHRLTVLDTPASVEKLVQLYLTTSDTSAESYTFYRALRESSHVAVIVPLLEAALSDPMANPLSNLARLLASLQVVQEVGPPPPQPLDPATRDEWQKKLQERDKVRDRYFARDNDLVLASLRRRSGPQ